MNEKINQTLLQEAVPQILEGIAPQEASTVSVEFERFLTMCLVKTDQSPSSQEEEETLRTGRYLIEETCKVPPEKRLEHIRNELLIEEINTLDGRARRMAENSLKKSADLPALREQARAIQDRIDELQHVLHAKGPEWEQGFVRMLSETSLDCGFVLGEHHFSSLRLGRRIQSMQEVGTWPPAWYAELWLKKDTKGE